MGHRNVVDAFASRAHYLDHIAPIWRALPERGAFLVPRGLAERAESLGVEPTVVSAVPSGGPVLVASMIDLMTTGERPVVLLEHGAGQTYSGNNGGYAGGVGRERVFLFLCPSERVAQRNRDRYPQSAAAVVGCPVLDRYSHREPRGRAVGISFHWDCPVAPEAMSAFEHYRDALPAVKVAFGEVLGHAHPRAFDSLAPVYERAGIEPVREFSEVMRRAGLYVADNTSTLYEFAATGRPVVVLNAPWYRRNVSHGVRFWEFADVGIQVDTPGRLVGAMTWASLDDEAQKRRREVITQELYGTLDGLASQRAAAAIMGGTT